MIIKLPNTTTTEVGKKLVELRKESGVVALGRVLTLLVVTEKGHEDEAINAAKEASHEHPCRVIVFASNSKKKKTGLDAELRLGSDAGASEIVILETAGELIHEKTSLVSNLLLPDSPIVTFWPDEFPGNLSTTSLGKISQRRITDSANADKPFEALEELAEFYTDGDTDFAWTRLTYWREQLVAVFNSVKNPKVKSITVESSLKSPRSYLLAAWLGLAFKQKAVLKGHKGTEGIVSVTIETTEGKIRISRTKADEIAELDQPNERPQNINLPHRKLADCLAEELRRMDADEVYGETLTKGLRYVELPK
ncbi:MAG: glucose-6-phosphate dehydrogenase assembly protein OpcA [Micrococcaceae bacterium]